jgi:hypothetical protein
MILIAVRSTSASGCGTVAGEVCGIDSSCPLCDPIPNTIDSN